nr:MAG TPA: hypothetical protein [Caudoviricetes sp.]
MPDTTGETIRRSRLPKSSERLQLRLHVLRSPDRPKHPAASTGASPCLKTTLQRNAPTAS